MKKLLIILLLVSTSAFAGEIIALRKGVSFDHDKHQTEWVGICGVCHGQQQQIGKIENFGKQWAHKNCIDCHDLYKEGPTGCNGCHSMV
jgi:cytochrome c553